MNAIAEIENSDVSSSESISADLGTILLVDDEKVVRMVTRRRLEKIGYQILEAENGRHALEILETESIDLIISDWMMPEMDGPSLCEAVKLREDWNSIYFILMTSLDLPTQIAEGLSRGANDFLTKSASEQEVKARVTAGLRTCRLIRELADSNWVISRQQAALEAELQSASEFVVSLLPPLGYPDPTVQLSWKYLPSYRLGGDLFQVTPWGDEYIGLMILDMSGHGIGPALRAVSLAMTFRDEHMAQRHPAYDPGEIIDRLNRENPLTEQGEYFTIWVGRYHVPSRELQYATAGHPGAILTRSGMSTEILGGKTLPVGFCSEADYQTQAITLVPDDRLYLFSDGIYEVLSPDEEVWGQDRLGLACENVHQQPIEEALGAVIQESQAWQQQEAFGDDVAIVGVQIL